jgi:hypothetical protein
MSQMRKAFCCAVCNEEIWEALARWVDGPLKGEIKSAKRPLPGSKQLTLVMGGGNRANMTLCKDCDLTAENVAETWRRSLARDAMERDEGFRRRLQPMLNRPAPTAKQIEWSNKMQRITQMDVPLLVLSTQALDTIYG